MEQSIGTHASWNDTFVRFIKNFKDKSQVLKYQKSLSKMVYHNSKSLIVDFFNNKKFLLNLLPKQYLVFSKIFEVYRRISSNYHSLITKIKFSNSALM